MPRIFIAINLPQELKENLKKLQEELSEYLPNIRWTKPENIHLTLAFLGPVKDLEKVIKITKEAAEGLESFKLRLKGLGVFPQARRARILWVGILNDSKLSSLNLALFRRLTQGGFHLDDRKFSPHITIGRIKEKIREALSFVLNKFKENEFGQFQVKSIEVMESQLRIEGPIYKVIEEIKLKSQK